VSNTQKPKANEIKSLIRSLNTNLVVILIALFAISSCSNKIIAKEQNMPNIQQPPRAKKVEHITEMHGHTLIDNYYWLKDQSISNPEVLAQVDAENNYAESILAKSKPLQEKIYQEMLRCRNINVESDQPEPESEIEYTQVGDWFYWEKAKNKDDHFKVRYRKKAEPETEETVLDLNEVEKNYEYFIANEIQYTTDHNYILVTCTVNDSEAETGKEQLILIFDVNAKVFLKPLKSPDVLLVDEENRVTYDWSEGIHMVKKIKRHRIGTDQAEDETLFHETEPNYTIWYSYVSESGKYLVLNTCNYLNNEWWFMDLEETNAKFKCFSPRTKNEFYKIYHSGDYFYIITNKDGAGNHKIMRATIDKTEEQYWQEIVPHSETVCISPAYLENVSCVFKNYFVWREIVNGFQRIKYINNQTNEIKEISFEIDAPFQQISFTGGEYDGDKFGFEVSSFARKWVEYEFDFITGELEQVWEQNLNNYQPELYQADVVMATAKDGVKVPIHLLYRKDLFKKDGTNPLFIEGYGAYGQDESCYDFRPERLSLIDRGFVYAYTQIRGGNYYGYQWYEAGIGMHKKNRYEDFIACTEYLLENKYADKNKVTACGFSAGGHLMGYIANNRPYLYKCIIPMIPSLDVINDLIDHDFHNIGAEDIENGDIKDKTVFEFICSHDPYNNIKKQAYPNIISIASLYDTQIGYWEPVKWVNKIRDYKTDKNQQFVLMLKEGHGGATTPNWNEKIMSTAYAYICDLFGITE